MNEEPLTDQVARQFLLGLLDDSERQRIESLFLSDSRVKETIIVVEDQLIDEFLEGDLTPSDRERFLAQYSATPRQQRTLNIARLIKDYAVAEGKLRKPAQTSKPRGTFFRWVPRSPRILVPITVALVIAIVAGSFWLIRLSVQRTQENNRRVSIEKELAELNGPVLRQETPEHVLFATLGPGSVRSFGRSNALKPATETNIIDLKLLWTQREQYPSYQAIIRRAVNGEAYTIINLHIDYDRDERAIRLRIPAHLLINGPYQISLIGVASNGEPGFSEEYNFTIDR